MAPQSQELSAPGSSSYTSPSMTVGDGTWDSQSNTFLLPNLQGLNFETMRYNGMGNRFKDMPGYFNLIQAHGIMAAIVFLFLVPFAIIFMRFNGRSPRWGLRVHIWCQVLTILLTTALFIAGFMAVGPPRSLTNPHHVIGLTIYILVLLQFFQGVWVHRREKVKRLPYEPLRATIHHWVGRLIGLLGLVQIPLGLTLYGAPAYLFILYSIVAFAIILIYFTLNFVEARAAGRDYDSEYSWASGSGSGSRRHGRLGTLAKSAAAGVGIGALANALRHRGDTVSHHTGSYVDEKYSQYGRDPGREKGLKRSIMGIGAIAGLSYWFGKILGKSRPAPSVGYTDSATESSGDSIERAEEGHAATATVPAITTSPPAAGPTQPLVAPAIGATAAAASVSHRRSHSSLSYDSYMSASPSRRRRAKPRFGMGLGEAAAGLGGLAFARDYFKRRKERKEQRRIDELRRQEIEDERVQRANSRKYTGDGRSRPSNSHASHVSASSVAEDVIRVPGSRTNVSATGPPFASGAIPMPVPPPIQDPTRLHESSGSEAYLSAGGRTRHRHHHANTSAAGLAAAATAGAAAGAVAGDAYAQRERQRHESHSGSRHRDSGATGGSIASPPVSVKLNMHSDGRHVTLRRLTEEEAAAERARQSRSRRRQRAADASASSLSGTPGGSVGPPAGTGERWRRADTSTDRQHAAAAAPAHAAASSSSPPVLSNLPPPPPIPAAIDPRKTSGGAGSVGSPGTAHGGDGTATETSGTNYENNRKRRRAERAAAARARQQQQQTAGVGGGGGGEFD